MRDVKTKNSEPEANTRPRFGMVFARDWLLTSADVVGFEVLGLDCSSARAQVPVQHGHGDAIYGCNLPKRSPCFSRIPMPPRARWPGDDEAGGFTYRKEFGLRKIGDLKKRSVGLYFRNLTEFMLKRGAGRGIPTPSARVPACARGAGSVKVGADS
jgi:hypothetical protein